MRISCRFMCASLIVLSSLPITGCTNEEDEVNYLIRSFGERHFPSENFFNQPNAVASLNQRWEATKATGNYGFAIVAVNKKTKSAKRILPRLCTSALSQPFRAKLAEQVSRELSIDVKQDVLIKLSGGKFILTNLKRKPFQQEGKFLLTGCEAEVKRVAPKKSKLALQYRLSKHLLKKEFYEDVAKVAKTLLKTKGFTNNAIAIIATAALNLGNKDALDYTKKFVDLDLINDPEILLLFSKAANKKKMKVLAINATNRCLQLKPNNKECSDFQLDIVVGKKNHTEADILDLESYL